MIPAPRSRRLVLRTGLAAGLVLAALAAGPLPADDPVRAHDVRRTGEEDRPARPVSTDEPLRHVDLPPFRATVVYRVTAGANDLRSVSFTGPVLRDWPEQQVRLVGKEEPFGARVSVRNYGDKAEALLVTIPHLPAGRTVVVSRTWEVVRRTVEAVPTARDFRRPPTPGAALREHLAAAPGVPRDDRRVTDLAKELRRDDAADWDQIAGIAAWIRANIRYVPGDYRGATGCLRDRLGDCEDMTALFVALCRASGVPARTVWVEGHAYAEFLLEDADAHGTWFPVQLAGAPWFGVMQEVRPLLQKGDRFDDPYAKKSVHYVPQSVRAVGGEVSLTSEWRTERVPRTGTELRP